MGPLDICPYCDCPANRPVTLKALRYVSLILAVGGLALLYLAAIGREAPLLEINSITPMQNFAYIKVTGKASGVSKPPRDQPIDYVSFKLTSGSNSLTVAAYDDCARKLFETGTLPGPGDEVEVTGSVNVNSTGRKRLTLDSPEQVRIIGRAPPKTTKPDTATK